MTNEQVLAILKILFPAGITGLGVFLFCLVLFLLYPEKVEKWGTILWAIIEKTGILYNKASKEKIKHSIQAVVTSFTKRLSNELPDFAPPSIKIDWVDPSSDRKAFLDGGKAVIHLRREDPNNENIATACMLYVSQILLRKASRYLSPTQKEAVELYIGYTMLEPELEEVFDVFIDKWLYPGIEKANEKISSYFDRFRQINEAGFFTPIFLQEIIYVGDKVYGRKRDNSIAEEVDGALEFLELHAQRRIGEHLDRVSFNGDACRFAIMIVGIPSNIDEQRYDVYLHHIRERLLPCGIETIYLIGPSKNEEFIMEIAKIVEAEFANPFKRNYKVTLVARDGTKINVDNHLLVLRRRVRQRYIA